MVSNAVTTSSSGPQKIIWASPSLAFNNLPMPIQSFFLNFDLNSSEWNILGFSRQAITFNRSVISLANIFPGWVKVESMPWKFGRLTATNLNPVFSIFESCLFSPRNLLPSTTDLIFHFLWFFTLAFNMSRISNNDHCLKASLWVNSGIHLVWATPLISTLDPPRQLTFTSCLPAPMPVRTFPVLLFKKRI